MAKKATLSNDIPIKIIQQISEIFKDFLSNNFDSCLESRMFPDELKLAKVTPVFPYSDNFHAVFTGVFQNNILYLGWYIKWLLDRKLDDKPYMASIYLLQVDSKNTRTACEICSNFFIDNFQLISHLVLVFILLTLNM